ACAVVTDPGLLKGDVIDAVAELVEKSLAVVETTETEPRLRLLETTRAYALERLAESGEREAVARRHAEHYRNLFERAEGEAAARPADEWLADYAREIDNLRAALDWAFSPGGDGSIGVALTAATVPLWMRLSLFTECHSRAKQATCSRGTGGRRAEMKLHAALGTSLIYASRVIGPEIGPALTSALEIAESLDDRTKGFVYVARQADPAQAAALQRIKLPGFGFYPEERRDYPPRTVAAQLLGYVGTDGNGLSGLELQFDRQLSGRPGKETITKDPGGQ